MYIIYYLSVLAIRSLLISSSINLINRIIVKNINTIDNIINRGVGRNEKIEDTKTSNNIPPRVSMYDIGSWGFLMSFVWVFMAFIILPIWINWLIADANQEGKV